MSKTTENPQVDLERLLSEAGITFTLVRRCPRPGCAVCDAPFRRKAA